ncbi:MAG TPA: hypothetical protein VGH48_17755, partial [Caldimonas sp.]
MGRQLGRIRDTNTSTLAAPSRWVVGAGGKTQIVQSLVDDVAARSNVPFAVVLPDATRCRGNATDPDLLEQRLGSAQSGNCTYGWVRSPQPLDGSPARLVHDANCGVPSPERWRRDESLLVAWCSGTQRRGAPTLVSIVRRWRVTASATRTAAS